jgi:hypothetical protein
MGDFLHKYRPMTCLNTLTVTSTFLSDPSCMGITVFLLTFQPYDLPKRQYRRTRSHFNSTNPVVYSATSATILAKPASPSSPDSVTTTSLASFLNVARSGITVLTFFAGGAEDPVTETGVGQIVFDSQSE